MVVLSSAPSTTPIMVTTTGVESKKNVHLKIAKKSPHEVSVQHKTVFYFIFGSFKLGKSPRLIEIFILTNILRQTFPPKEYSLL